MNRKKLAEVKKLCKEMIERIGKLEKDEPNKGFVATIIGTKASGAVRRMSMELTRALSELRKP